MKYLITFLAMFTALTVSISPLRADEMIDRVVAQVNDDIITLSELNEKGKPFFQAIMSQPQKTGIEEEIQRARVEVLDKLIEELLLQQEAADYGINIATSDIDQAINSILSQNKITMEQFRHELKRIGTNEESYRQNIKNQMLRSRLINSAIRSKILVTEQQVKDYYTQYYTAKADAPEGYHIMQIGLQWGGDKRLKNEAAADALAKKIMQELAAGNDFAAVAKKYSQLPSAEDGGDIGAFKENEMAPYMLQAVQAMHPGETSGIIKTPKNDLQILKLISLRKNGVTAQPPMESVKNEIEDIIYKKEMKKEYEKWLSTLHSKAYIKKNL